MFDDINTSQVSHFFAQGFVNLGLDQEIDYAGKLATKALVLLLVSLRRCRQFLVRSFFVDYMEAEE